MINRHRERQVAERLAELYEMKFGGKERGRYRFPMKQMRALMGRKRVSPEIIRRIAEEVFELGYVMIDLETYFVVLAQGTFRSYRRVSEGCLAATSIAVGEQATRYRPTNRTRL